MSSIFTLNSAKGVFLSFLIFGACLSSAALAQDDKPDFAAERLTGDWGGARSNLYDKGLAFDINYKADAWRNVSGGANEGNRVSDNLDVMMSVDGEKAFGVNGMSGFLYLLSNSGGRINDLVGSNGGVDNIEAPTHAVRLYQAWVQQNFMDDKISVLAGLHDLNSEFYVTDTSGLFINPTYGIGTEMAATGDNGPSIFPVTSLGVRVNVQPTDVTYIRGAVYDGVPGDVDNPRGTHVQFKDNDGALLVGEAGVQSDDIGHFGVGAWTYTAQREDQRDAPETAHSRGVYFLADKSLYSTDDGKDISAFARIGFTGGDVEQFENSWGAGVVLSGFVPSRSEGQIGFALAQNSNADKYREVNDPVDGHETQFELTYNDKLMPWLSVQPDVQYTVNPGTDVTLDNAWTVGLRLGVDF